MKQTQDLETIRSWVEARGGKPIEEKQGTDPEAIPSIGLQFKPLKKADSISEITWEEFMRRMLEKKLVFVFDETSEGDPTEHFRFEPSDEQPQE